MPNKIVVTLTDAQKTSVFDAAARAGMEPGAYLMRSAYRMSILEAAGPELFQQLIAGLDDIDAGRYATSEKVEEVFDKYRRLADGTSSLG